MKPYTTKKKKLQQNTKVPKSVKELPSTKYFISKNSGGPKLVSQEQKKAQNPTDVIGTLQNLSDRFQQRSKQILQAGGLKDRIKDNDELRIQDWNLQSYASEMNKKIATEVFAYQEKLNTQFAQFVVYNREEQQLARTQDLENIEQQLSKIEQLQKEDGSSPANSKQQLKVIKQKLDSIEKHIDSTLST